MTGAAHEKELDIARIFVFCVLIGSALLWVGVRRLKTARQQGVILILLAILLNGWWIVFMVMELYKTAFVKRGS